MEKLEYKIEVNVGRQQLWDFLWSDITYPQWTSVFCEGSVAKTDWKQGSKVLFLDGKGSGMVSRIAKMRVPEYMSFEHLGEVKYGVEDTLSEKVKTWAGAHENYTLNEVGGVTELTVDIDINDEMKGYFEKTWPKAMQKIKQLAEA